MGYSECSQGYSECSQGTLGYSHGLSVVTPLCCAAQAVLGGGRRADTAGDDRLCAVIHSARPLAAPRPRLHSTGRANAAAAQKGAEHARGIEGRRGGGLGGEGGWRGGCRRRARLAGPRCDALQNCAVGMRQQRRGAAGRIDFNDDEDLQQSPTADSPPLDPSKHIERRIMCAHPRNRTQSSAIPPARRALAWIAPREQFDACMRAGVWPS
jgi:hypothetical protein